MFFILTGSTVLGFSLSDGRDGFSGFLAASALGLLALADLWTGTFPALVGGVREPLDPADPCELVRPFTLPELAILTSEDAVLSLCKK